MHERKISVIGLGYVGLPVAVAFGQQCQCIGFDINQERINNLKLGIDHTNETNVNELKQSNILFTFNPEDLKSADFHIVAVPTPVDNAHKPDLTPVESASRILAQVLKVGDIVVYESTVYPGVTEEICLPILEQGSGLKCGVDFTLGYSPERINPGDKERGFTTIKKIVSGQDQQTLDIVAEVYGSVVTAGVYLASSIKVAEAAKVIENTQRDLNIALMNELSVIFERMQINTLEVLEAAGSKWNFMPFRPGLVGGHCIGVDPYYLTYKAELLGYIPQVILSGRRINDNMGRYVARRAIKQLMKTGHSMQNLQAIVLGITFKENCPDVRNSKVVDVVKELSDYNAKVFVYDPLANNAEAKEEYGVDLVTWEELPAVSLMIVAVAHDEFRNQDLAVLITKLNPGAIIFDVKSILPKDKLVAMGYNVCTL